MFQSKDWSNFLTETDRNQDNKVYQNISKKEILEIKELIKDKNISVCRNNMDISMGACNADEEYALKDATDN